MKQQLYIFAIAVSILFIGIFLVDSKAKKEASIMNNYTYWKEADELYGRDNRKSIEWKNMALYGSNKKQNYLINDTLILDLPEEFIAIEKGDTLIVGAVENYDRIKFIALRFKNIK